MRPPSSRQSPVIGIALDAAGPDATARQLVGLALAAERGDIDFVSLGDTFDPRPPATAHVALDALLCLAHVAAATTTIGLLPTVTVTHTEPFHVSKNIATLDLVSGGRGGWQVAVSTTPQAAARFGRTSAAPLDELFAEADDVVEVVRRLWDSWEDDAVIRDRPTGRYLDRDKVHYVDFEGPRFDVRGPSITPRPPQGQPVVAVGATDDVSTGFAGRRADLVFVDGDRELAGARRSSVRAAATAAGRDADDITVLVTAPVRDDVVPGELAARLADWYSGESIDGVLLQPDVSPDRLGALVERIVDDVLPALAGHGLRAPDLRGTTFRDRLGLAKPANRYAASTRGSLA